MMFTYTPAGARADRHARAQLRSAGQGRRARAGRDRAEACAAVPPARAAGSRRHGAGRHRHGAVGRARAPARRVARRAFWAARRSRCPPTARSATTARPKSARVAEDWAKRGFTRRQGQDRLSDRGRGRRRHPRDAQGGRSRRRDHGRLQPVAARLPKPCSACACSTTRASRGSRSPRSRTTTPDMRWSRAKPRRRSSAARTGGARSTSSTRSTRRPPTT